MARKRHRRRRNPSATAAASPRVPSVLPPPFAPLPNQQQEHEADEDQSNAIRTISLGEIWAFPLESDGCPRSYARVDRILPFPLPSLLRVTPLLLHPVTDEDFLCSENSLPVPCGVFRPSPTDAPVLKPVPAFSHRVTTLPDPSGSEFYRIFPSRGEVWAVYDRYVDPKVGFEYRLVEIVSRFDEEKGVDVAALVVVEREGEEDEERGAKVYRRQLVQERFERKAMFLFSHRVVATRIVRDGKNFWKVSS